MEKEIPLLPRIPVSTYRLQFNIHFRFSDAADIIRYLNEIGVTDIYSSPYFKTKEGSLHGYDIVDPNTLNPEIGAEKDFNGMIHELQKYKMGQVLDIVPNHMCIDSKDNAWWMDVLENGPSSSYAGFFDIDWEPVKKELRNKVLLPVLGDQYGVVLEKQELRVSFEEGAFYIYYYENRFPIELQTYNLILEYRLNEIEERLSPDNQHFIELLSIITSIKHLPPYTEPDPEKIIERQREKEVAKKRLCNLYNLSPDIRDFIDENVHLFNGQKGDSKSFDFLDNLLTEQIYRLSYWRVATEEINYRRFFDVNSLAAIRMEDPVVFQESHKAIFKLIQERKATGLRVDHPDGLYNPLDYFQRLQKNCFIHMRLGYLKKLKKEIPAGFYQDLKDDSPLNVKTKDVKSEILKQYNNKLLREPHYKPFYIVGEKILIKGEKMPEEWPIFSTTGYVFLNSVNGIFIDTRNAKNFDEIYTRFIRTTTSFFDTVYEKKKLVMQVAMSSEVNTLGHYLNRISEKSRHTRDFTLNSLRTAIVEVIAFFPVYRTYISGRDVKDRDRQCIEIAVAKANRKNPAVSKYIFDFLKDVLLLNFPEDLPDENKMEWLDFCMRFQQITGPVMAKGLEDTAFYVYNRFASLNEVGGSPERFGTSLETFHGQNIERSKFWPHALIATSTHDTKRSEDVRARINVLSEIPEEWKRRLVFWSRSNRKKKAKVDGQYVPDRNEEYLLYQTLLGAWPTGIMDEPSYDYFKGRMKEYMIKVIREAKVNTSWVNPNSLYEGGVVTFIEAVLDSSAGNLFLEDFLELQKKVSNYGMYNSLSQVLLKITSPGVPDFYQGTEIWDFSLVDPDNRRPVDYNIRMKMLEELKQLEAKMSLPELAGELTRKKEDGMIKFYLTYKALNYRRANRKLFEKGEYVPLLVMGEHANNVCAFSRRLGNNRIIVAVPRFLVQLVPNREDLPFGETVWGDSFIVVPIAEPGARYRNIFTGEVVKSGEYEDATALLLSGVFADFPVAMLEKLY